MDRLSTFAALVTTAIVTTVVLFLTALIAWGLGPTAIYFICAICIPVDCILLVCEAVLIYVCLSGALHFFKLKRADEEHRYELLREHREIELAIRKLELAEHRRKAHKRNYAARHYQLRQRSGNNQMRPQPSV